MGRTGKWWACDHAGIEPDIMCVAKGIASGMPLSATIARAELDGLEAGRARFDFRRQSRVHRRGARDMDLLETQYIENAARMGEFIMRRMADWRERHRIVGDVRGQGLMIGIEIVRDQKTKEKAPDLRNRIVEDGVSQKDCWFWDRATRRCGFARLL